MYRVELKEWQFLGFTKGLTHIQFLMYRVELKEQITLFYAFLVFDKFLMYRVELKVVLQTPEIRKSSLFLMYRVELKDSLGKCWVF